MTSDPDTQSTPAPTDSGLLPRAILALLMLPGIVAFAVPIIIVNVTHAAGPFARAGLLELALGSAALLACTRDFYVSGRGTLAPWSPPVTLVRNGLYRWSRNPMYIGVLLIVMGWALGYSSRPLWIYAGMLAVAVQLRVILGEEPYLARTFPDEWKAYRKRVPRWVL
jgi:protein-S-isoprenylcysteine O-methyltransferase Ste14